MKLSKLLSLILVTFMLLSTIPTGSYAFTELEATSLTEVQTTLTNLLGIQEGFIFVTYTGLESYNTEQDALNAAIETFNLAKLGLDPFNFYNLYVSTADVIVTGTLGDLTITDLLYGFTFKNTRADVVWFEANADIILAGIIKPDMTTSQKVYAIYDYTLDNLEYGFRDDIPVLATKVKSERNIKLALTDKDVVCEAYAYVMYLLLEELGINAEIVVGDAGTSEKTPHMWNMVEVDGTWYILDATWGDTEYSEILQAHINVGYSDLTNPTAEEATQLYMFNHKKEYFLTSTVAIDDTHDWESLPYTANTIYDYASATSYVEGPSVTESDLALLLIEAEENADSVFNLLVGESENNYYTNQLVAQDRVILEYTDAIAAANNFLASNTGIVNADWELTLNGLVTATEAFDASTLTGTVALPNNLVSLQATIEETQVMLASIVPSVDGHDVQTSEKWATQSQIDSFSFILTELESVIVEFPSPSIKPSYFNSLKNDFDTELANFFTSTVTYGLLEEVVTHPVVTPPVVTPPLATPTVVTPPVVSLEMKTEQVNATTLSMDFKKNLVIKSSDIQNALTELISDMPVRSATPTLTIETAIKSDGVSYVELNVDALNTLIASKANLQVTNNNVSYNIKASELNGNVLAKSLGLSIEAFNKGESTIEILITEVPIERTKALKSIASGLGMQIMATPFEFDIVVTNGTRSANISQFSNYVERLLPVPIGVNVNNISTGVVFNEDGSFRPVPSQVVLVNNKYFVKINSLTNSVYSYVWNDVTVEKVIGHWSENAVNDMASRLVISNPESFDPSTHVTRAEFATYIVKALGIYRDDYSFAQKFSDVTPTNKDFVGIMTANSYGIVTGKPDMTFNPNGTITRQEAMAMYAKAMGIVSVKAINNNKLATFSDANQVATWAKESVSNTVSVGIFNGTGNGKLSPLSTLTHAEAITAVRNLLIKANLISK